MKKKKNKKILMIDDDVAFLSLMQAVCKSYELVLCSNLSEARSALKKLDADLIFLDVMMPDGNGIEFIDEIKTSGNTAPIVLLTAVNKGTAVSDAYKKGIADFILKPFPSFQKVRDVIVKLTGE